MQRFCAYYCIPVKVFKMYYPFQNIVKLKNFNFQKFVGDIQVVGHHRSQSTAAAAAAAPLPSKCDAVIIGTKNRLKVL